MKKWFDPKISTGHILTIVTFLVAAIGAYGDMRAYKATNDARISRLEERDKASAEREAICLEATQKLSENVARLEERISRNNRSQPFEPKAQRN